MKKLVVCVAFVILFLTGCSVNYMEEAEQFLKEKNYNEAAVAFEKAAEDSENTVEATRGIAICLYEQDEYQNAKDTYQKVLDNGGKATPEMYNIMGICAMQLEDYVGAIGLFQSGLALVGAESGTEAGPEEHKVLVQEMKFNEIVCYEKLQDWENAKIKMQEYVALYPDDGTATKEADFLSTR